MSQAEESSIHSTWNIVRSVVCIILSLSFIIGTPGNCIVIWTVCTKMKKVSPSVLLILNLAIADVLVLITLPVWIYSFADSWVFGVIFCKILVFIIYCSMYASIFLITALSLERLMAVFYPFTIQRYKTKEKISLIMFLIWFLSITFGVSVIPFQETEETNGRLLCTCRNYSSNRQKVSYLLLETLAGFVIPFLIICTCYVCVARRISRMTYQSKQRSERLIASIVVAFILCWFPHHLFNILDIISIQIELSNKELSLALDEIVGRGVYISGALVFISSCINPLLYAFAAQKFQNHLRFAKISKLFEQMSQTVTEEDKKKSLGAAKQEETLASTENL
ncbi:leukotriene B4 receptor 1-like [Falco biarmicus]|uniref:leukotriene B4 receptor 1-like n=1 Tax=Falco cherrug TaxID=345164 RepID=UPI00188693AA|nr:leukotriene B4 receptor 1-like [Falco cherrug]XP_037265378.1 leukotriene B4 receptor 1-like [Falco rusticolus]XP_056216627.1 leukotriene B4 receptor 1-like [Falco biarmicus]